jgi:hypothetical protein
MNTSNDFDSSSGSSVGSLDAEEVNSLNGSDSEESVDENNMSEEEVDVPTAEAEPSEGEPPAEGADTPIEDATVDDIDNNNEAVFSPAASSDTNAVTFDNLYELESKSELVEQLSKKSDVVKETIKILVLGVKPEYIKYEPNRDVYGFLLSKDQKENINTLYQTNTCRASVQQVNIPSLNTKLTIDTKQYKDIFKTCVTEDAISVLQKLKSNNQIPSEGDNSVENTMCFTSANTPYLELLLIEQSDDSGKIVVLIGDDMESSFNFFKCKSLMVDDTMPKKVYLSSVLNVLAESGAEHITLINLSSNSDGKSNVNIVGPSKEVDESDNSSDSSEDSSDEEEERTSEVIGDNLDTSRSGPQENTSGMSEENTSGMSEGNTSGMSEGSTSGMSEGNTSGMSQENTSGMSQENTSMSTEDKVSGSSQRSPSASTSNNLSDSEDENPNKLVMGEPTKVSSSEVENVVGGKKSRKHKPNLNLKPFFKKTRSKKP